MPVHLGRNKPLKSPVDSMVTASPDGASVAAGSVDSGASVVAGAVVVAGAAVVAAASVVATAASVVAGALVSAATGASSSSSSPQAATTNVAAASSATVFVNRCLMSVRSPLRWLVCLELGCVTWPGQRPE